MSDCYSPATNLGSTEKAEVVELTADANGDAVSNAIRMGGLQGKVAYEGMSATFAYAGAAVPTLEVWVSNLETGVFTLLSNTAGAVKLVDGLAMGAPWAPDAGQYRFLRYWFKTATMANNDPEKIQVRLLRWRI